MVFRIQKYCGLGSHPFEPERGEAKCKVLGAHIKVWPDEAILCGLSGWYGFLC